MNPEPLTLIHECVDCAHHNLEPWWHSWLFAAICLLAYAACGWWLTRN